jgi:hypothetical protein
MSYGDRFRLGGLPGRGARGPNPPVAGRAVGASRIFFSTTFGGNFPNVIGAQETYIRFEGFWRLTMADIYHGASQNLEPSSIYLSKTQTLDQQQAITLDSGESGEFQRSHWEGEKFLEGEWYVIGYLFRGQEDVDNGAWVRCVAEKLHPGRGL